jgi:hypothetical protein
MASALPPTAQAPEPERVSSIGRIFGVFFSPKATFESIARRPSWLAPLVLLCLVALGIVASFSYRGGWPSYFQKQVENSSRFQQMPPDQQQRVLAAQLKYGPKVAYVQVVVVPFLAALIVAAVLLGVFNVLLGTKVQFATSFGIVSHSFLPSLISGLLGILVIFLKDPSMVDLQNLVASNAAAFLSNDAPRWQIALLGSFDLFSFWTMLLLAMGYSAAAPKKISMGKGLISILGIWLVWVLVKVGLIAAFS